MMALIQDPQPNLNAVWIQLILSITTLITIIVVPLIQDWRARNKAEEVKAALGKAEQKLTEHAVAREAKLDVVVAKTEVIEKTTNGQSEAKDREIAALKARVRALGGIAE
jgi:hypothetical protein